MQRIVLVALLLMQALLTGSSALAAGVDHTAWDLLLKKHVVAVRGGRATQVDYAGFAADHRQLGEYLSQLSMVRRADFDRWPGKAQLAFLINAYNAWTIELILSKYPDLKSIKDLGSLLRSPWKREFIPLLGKTRTLDDIEHELILGSGRYNEPRVHFALNCASVGCPALRGEAWTAQHLEAQLEEATRLFLSDGTRNRLNEGTLEISKIFKWYRSDFEQNWRATISLRGFLARYAKPLKLTDQTRQRLLDGDINIDYLDYDWKLNARR